MNAMTSSANNLPRRLASLVTVRRTLYRASVAPSSVLAAPSPIKSSRLFLPERRGISNWKGQDVGFKRPLFSTRAAAVGVTAIGVQWLIGIGVFIVCIAASVFFISAISTLTELKLAARRVNLVARLLELEMPETMAAMRLSSIEISDCIEEFTALGSDLASGLRSSANAVAAAEKGVQEGTRMIQDSLLPALQSQGPRARKVLEDLLQERAMLDHDRVLNLDRTRQTTNRLRAIRQGVNAIGMGIKTASFWKAFPNKR